MTKIGLRSGGRVPLAVADPRGEELLAPPPPTTKFFSISCSFGGKFNEFVSQRLHLRVGAPRENPGSATVLQRDSQSRGLTVSRLCLVLFLNRPISREMGTVSGERSSRRFHGFVNRAVGCMRQCLTCWRDTFFAILRTTSSINDQGVLVRKYRDLFSKITTTVKTKKNFCTVMKFQNCKSHVAI